VKFGEWKESENLIKEILWIIAAAPIMDILHSMIGSLSYQMLGELTPRFG
jgi:hypothetical protein